MSRVESAITRIIIGLTVSGVISGFSFQKQSSDSPPSNPALQLQNKRVLYVNSYHAEYPWSDEITEGLRAVLGYQQGVELKIHLMNTHGTKSEAFMQQAAQEALEVIEAWKPDLVITSDDNAIKYVVEPHLDDTPLPVVFCGVNWNLDRYQLATNRNVTGILEVAHYRQLIDALTPYAAGTRLGVISGKNVNTEAEVAALRKEFPEIPILTYAVQTFAEWETMLKEACGEVDILLVDNNVGIPNWDADKAKRLIRETVRIPTGSPNDWMAEYCLVTFAKSADEQGRWAAGAALEILQGTSPASIPVATAKKAKIFLNMEVAKRLNIIFPMELIENAHLIAADREPADRASDKDED